MMRSPEMKQRRAPVPSQVCDDRTPEIRQLNGLTRESEPVRSALYGVRDPGSGPVLVRYSVERDQIYVHEPVQHQDYGITDEDLCEAIRQDTLFGELHGISRITPDISRKLQILYLI